jgi:hypothetical protein
LNVFKSISSSSFAVIEPRQQRNFLVRWQTVCPCSIENGYLSAQPPVDYCNDAFGKPQIPVAKMCVFHRVTPVHIQMPAGHPPAALERNCGDFQV